ncbi:O-antigen ligase family protein [Iodobacter arcticus]|uniref:O-antigen ligase family protein n=1 Tax=Iodobacter arcticus TaxID=590593 RepID=A0ABW2QWD4_9NEIS
MKEENNNRSFFIVIFIFILMMGEFRIFSGISGMVSFTVLELAIYFGFAHVFLSLVANPLVIPVWKDAFFESKWVMLYALLAGVGSALAFIAGAASGLQAFKDVLPACLLVPLVLFFTDNKKQLWILFLLLIVLGLLSAAMGIMQGLVGWPYIFDVDVGNLGKMALDGSVLKSNVAIGFFRHPNGLGLYLVFPVVGIFMLAFYVRSILFKALCVIGLFLMLTAFYYAQTKGAFIWSLVGVACSLAYLFIGKNAGRFVIVLFPLLIFSIVSFSLSSTEHTLSTMQTRYQLWQSAIHVFLNSDFKFFTGSLQFEMLRASDYYTFGKFIYPNAHNTYLNIVINYGIFSLLAFVFLFCHIILEKISNTEDKELKYIVCAIKGGIVGLLGIYFFEPAAAGVLIQAQFFALVAIIYKARSIIRSEK